MPIEIQIGQLMEEEYLKPFDSSFKFKIVQNHIKNQSALIPVHLDCSLLPGCSKKVRKILIQLLMVEWGIYGIGSSAAGLFLANQHSALGPYFGNENGHNWPNEPLAKPPSALELEFNKKLVEVTELLSNGKVSNISILDLPAFGSKIAWLRKQHKRESNWPTEMNFAMRNRNESTMPVIFKTYKTLLEHWENFMIKVYKKDPLATFTPLMENNTFFDFTNYIKSDMLTYLIVTHGSFLTTSDKTSPIWKQLASLLFKSDNILHDHSGKGLYDKLVMQCGFQEDIFKQEMVNLHGGCKLFDPVLTSNGMCYSFNGENSIWKSSNMTKAFKSIFPSNQKREVFQRAGETEGKSKSILDDNLFKQKKLE